MSSWQHQEANSSIMGTQCTTIWFPGVCVEAGCAVLIDNRVEAMNMKLGGAGPSAKSSWLFIQTLSIRGSGQSRNTDRFLPPANRQIDAPDLPLGPDPQIADPQIEIHPQAKLSIDFSVRCGFLMMGGATRSLPGLETFLYGISKTVRKFQMLGKKKATSYSPCTNVATFRKQSPRLPDGNQNRSRKDQRGDW